jgi:hypothetical protein
LAVDDQFSFPFALELHYEAERMSTSKNLLRRDPGNLSYNSLPGVGERKMKEK